MTKNELRIGQTIHTLPDCGSGRIIKIEEGTEHGDPVVYVTIVNTLGQEITRWIEKSRVR